MRTGSASFGTTFTISGSYSPLAYPDDLADSFNLSCSAEGGRGSTGGKVPLLISALVLLLRTGTHRGRRVASVAFVCILAGMLQ